MNSNFIFLFSLLGKHKRLLFSSLAVTASISLLGTLLPYFSKYQIDQLQTGSGNLLGTNLSPSFIFFILLLVPFLIEVLRNSLLKSFDVGINRKITFSAMKHIREIVWKKFREMDGAFFENSGSRRIINMVIRSDVLIKDFLQFVGSIINALVLVIISIPVLGSVGWQLILVTLISAILTAVISSFQQKREAVQQVISDRSFDRFYQIDSLLTYDYLEARLLGATAYFQKKFDDILKDQYQIEKEEDKIRTKYGSLDSITNDASILVVNFLAGLWVLNASYSIGTYTMVVMYTLQISRAFRVLTRLLRTWMDIDLRIMQLRFFLDIKPKLIFVDNKKVNNPKSLSLVNAHFSYKGYGSDEKSYIEKLIKRSKNYIAKYGQRGVGWQLKNIIENIDLSSKSVEVLRGVDFKLECGEVVALLGRNGVGKSTLINLLLHNNELDSGEVHLDGTKINYFDQESVFQQFAIIQQKPIIYEGFSIRENLIIGTPSKTTDEKIWKQLKLVGLYEKIKSLPKQLDTLIGFETNFSAGQSQLLVIARVFLQERPFIIFDEGMSNLDAENEMHIVKLLKSQTKKSAILFITHRITAARHADRIVVIDSGKIVQEGNHSSLVNKRGVYKHFWNLQVVS